VREKERERERERKEDKKIIMISIRLILYRDNFTRMKKNAQKRIDKTTTAEIIGTVGNIIIT